MSSTEDQAAAGVGEDFRRKWERYYKKDFRPWDSEQVSSQLKDLLVSGRLLLPEGARVLELGCGTGASCIWMATELGKTDIETALPDSSAAARVQQGHVGEVVGVDIEPLAIARCQERAAAAMGTHAAASVTEMPLSPSGVHLETEHAHEVAGSAADLPPTPRIFSGSSTSANSVVQPTAVTFLVHDALNLPAAFLGAFDFIYDCQTFHALYPLYPHIADVLTQSLSLHGHLFVLTGNDGEGPSVGPTIMSRAQVVGAFPTLHCVFIEETRFDPTPHYAQLPRRPLAWCALFCKNMSTCPQHDKA